MRDSPKVFDLVVRPAWQAFRDLRPAVSDLGPRFGHRSLLSLGPCALLDAGVCFYFVLFVVGVTRRQKTGGTLSDWLKPILRDYKGM